MKSFKNFEVEFPSFDSSKYQGNKWIWWQIFTYEKHKEQTFSSIDYGAIYKKKKILRHIDKATADATFLNAAYWMLEFLYLTS